MSDITITIDLDECKAILIHSWEKLSEPLKEQLRAVDGDFNAL